MERKSTERGVGKVPGHDIFCLFPLLWRPSSLLTVIHHLLSPPVIVCRFFGIYIFAGILHVCRFLRAQSVIGIQKDQAGSLAGFKGSLMPVGSPLPFLFPGLFPGQIKDFMIIDCILYELQLLHFRHISFPLCYQSFQCIIKFPVVDPVGIMFQVGNMFSVIGTVIRSQIPVDCQPDPMICQPAQEPVFSVVSHISHILIFHKLPPFPVSLCRLCFHTSIYRIPDKSP